MQNGVQAGSLGSLASMGDSAAFASGMPMSSNSMPMNAGPPMGSIGSQKDLTELYRRYNSVPKPSQMPPRLLSLHDSAGSAGLEEVARCGPGLSSESQKGELASPKTRAHCASFS